MLRSGHPELGPVESVYYVERPQSFVSFFVTTLVITSAALGLIYIDIPACAGVVMLILVPVTIDLLRGRKNSLTIHENGLAYTGLFRTRTCRWEDVEELGHVIDRGTMPKDHPEYLRKARGFCVWVVKRNGGKINTRPDLKGIRDAVIAIATGVFGPEHVAAHPEDYGTGSIRTTRTG